MSRSTNTRRRAAELWSRLLMDNSTPFTLTALAEVLQDLAEEFDKRVLTAFNDDIYSLAWLDYFVAVLKKVLRELPPYKDVDSIDELRKEIARLEGINPPAETTASLNVSAADANADDANIADDNTPTASNRVNTSTTGTDTTFKVDTQGDYKARVVKDGTKTAIEFQLNGPATVTVQVHTSGTAAARGTPSLAQGHAYAPFEALVLAAAAARPAAPGDDIPAEGSDGAGNARPAAEA